MRKVYKYRKIQGTKKQKENLEKLNKFKDEFSKEFYNPKIKNKT